MNTPSHVAASLLVWRRETTWRAVSAVIAGALLPDAPMFVFYSYQKIVGRGERQIWEELYFDGQWQQLFDWLNSIPLFGLIAVICWWMGWRWVYLCAASAVLHMVCDLPLHHDDAHRHFLPLTNWRYASPISYWDPRHYGYVLLRLELVLAAGVCLYLIVFRHALPVRIAAGGTLAIYVLFLVFAIMMWMDVG